MQTSVQFDGTEIITSSYSPRFVQHESAPDRNLFMLPITREDGEVLIANLYDKKIIRLQGMIHGIDSQDMEEKLDAFKELFSRPERNLDIQWAGGTRRYIATCSKHEFTRDFYNIDAVPWTAEFTVVTGLGYDTEQSTVIDEDITTIDDGNGGFYWTSSYTFDGSKAPKPIITITLTGKGAPSVMKGIQYMNNDTLERILITRDYNWSTLTGRQIKIDCFNKKVYDNFADVDVFAEGPFFGTFPKFQIGSNNVQINTGGFQNIRDSGGALIGGDHLLGLTTDRIAQSFRVSYTDPTFASMKVTISTEGSPAGDVVVEIQTDNNGAPSGSLVDANATGTIPNGDISNTREYHLVTFDGAFTLDANTRYWIVLSITSGSGYIDDFNVSNIENGYPQGTRAYSSDSGSTYTQSAAGKSIGFIFYFGGQAAATEVEHKVDYTRTYL